MFRLSVIFIALLAPTLAMAVDVGKLAEAVDEEKAVESVDQEKLKESIDGTDIDVQKAVDSVDKQKAAESVDMEKVKEALGSDAAKAAEALDIALTKRGKHLGDDIPMCGVPVHSAETVQSSPRPVGALAPASGRTLPS